MKKITAHELQGIINRIHIDYYDYDENCNTDLEFEFENVCVIADVYIVANEVRDTSNLDYFNGTGYSSEVVRDGYIEKINKIDYYYNDEPVIFDTKSTELILNKINSVLFVS